MIEELEKNDEIVVFDLIEKFFKTKYIEVNPFEKFIVYKEKKILGFASYSILYERAELNYILVVPEYQNKGIASLLMNYMIDDLKKQKVENITLEVNENNLRAIKIYRNYGFQNVAIRKKYYGNMDALLMKKELR